MTSKTIRRIRGKELLDWYAFNIICERDFEKFMKLKKG